MKGSEAEKSEVEKDEPNHVEDDENSSDDGDGKKTHGGGLKPVQRASAAALGFSTVGMTDEEVLQAVVTNYGRSKKEEEKKNGQTSGPMKGEKKGQNDENDGDSLDDVSISSLERSKEPLASSGPSTDSSSESSSSTSDESDAKKSDKDKDTGKFQIRTQFPKTNIRRWMTPGARFDVPSIDRRSEDINQGTEFKQTQMTEWMKPQTFLVEETEKENTEVKEDSGAAEKDWPVPTHRRRTKSWRGSF